MKNLIWMLLFLLSMGYSSLAQERQALIEVLGKSTVKDIPEQVEITLPLKIIDSTFVKCSEQLSASLSLLQSDFISEGLSKDKVNTTQYSIAENFEYINGKRISKGFRGTVNIMVNFKYSPKMISRIIGLTKRHGHDFFINFQLSETQKSHLSALALKEAVSDAKAKADILARASGVKLGEIHKISYGQLPYRPEPLTMTRLEDAGYGGGNDLNLSPPMISSNQSVLIEWEILN